MLMSLEIAFRDDPRVRGGGASRVVAEPEKEINFQQPTKKKKQFKTKHVAKFNFFSSSKPSIG